MDEHDDDLASEVIEGEEIESDTFDLMMTRSFKAGRILPKAGRKRIPRTTERFERGEAQVNSA